MSIEQLKEAFRVYGIACNARHTKLAQYFWAIVVLALLPIPVQLFCFNIRAFVLPYYAVVLPCFVALAVFIPLTSYKFHKQHGVFCPHCGASLAWADEELALGEAGLQPKLQVVHCRKCRAVVA